MKWILSLILMSFCVPLWASVPLLEGRVVAFSTSGKTIVLNLGLMEGIKEGDLLVLAIKIDDKTHPMPTQLVGKGKIVKVNRENSLVLLNKIYDKSLLRKNQVYFVFNDSNFLHSRSKIESTRLKIISEEGKNTTDLKDHMTQDRDKLAKKSSDYNTLYEAHKIPTKTSKDFEIIDLDSWEKIGKNKKATEIYRSPYNDDFAQQRRVDTFEKMVVNYLQKINTPGFSYEKFYEEQKKDEVTQIFKEKNNQTSYMTYLEDLDKKKIKDEHLYQDLLNKGESWSEDFSDEELSGMVKKVGVLFETERRKTLYAKNANHQMYGSVGLNVADNQNREDQENSTKATFDINIGSEYFWFKDHARLNLTSFDSSFRMNNDGVSIGAYNAFVREYSFAFAFQWYPFVPPTVVEKNIVFMGVGARVGMAQLTIGNPNESANYTLLGLPIFRLGIKYQFRSGYGLRLMTSMETLTLDTISSQSPEAFLPARTKLVDARIGIGVSYFY
jgi:hypothetical protein